MDSTDMDLSKIPLALNPSGAPPNFADPPSLESAFLGVGVSLMVISTILITIRVIANCKHVGRLGFDDYICIAGWSASIAYWALFKTLVKDGTARHAWDVPISVFTSSYVKRLLAQQVLGNFAMWAVKACILMLFIRIFDSVRWIRNTAYVLIISTGIFYLAAIAIWSAYCTPRAGEDWGATALARASSQDITGLVVTIGVVGLLVDLIMFALPFPIIIGLHLPYPKKLGLLLVFAVAFCTVAAACASLAYRIIAHLGARGDPTWVGMNVCITSIAEQFGAVIVSCAPSLSSFWYNVFKKSRIYSSTLSKFSNGANRMSNNFDNAIPRCYAPDEHFTTVQMKTYDPYQVINACSGSKISEDDTSHKEQCSGTFITSAVDKPTHVTSLSEIR